MRRAHRGLSAVVRHAKPHHILAMPSHARSDLPSPTKGLEGIAVVRISNGARMADLKLWLFRMNTGGFAL
jgi:hypothetical protein